MKFPLSLPKLGLCIVLGPVLALLLPTWTFVLAAIVVGALIGHWPNGARLGPLLLLERMDDQNPLGIYVASWHHHTDHDPGLLRWSFEWIAAADRALYPPAWANSAVEFGQYAPAHIRTMRLDLPLLGMFTLVIGRDLVPTVEV